MFAGNYFKIMARHIIAPEFTKDIVNSLKEACTEIGTDITEVCRRAGIHRDTVEKWKTKPPKTLEIIIRIQEALEAIEKEKAEAA